MGCLTSRKYKPRSHRVWEIDIEELREQVRKSETLSAVLRHFGFIAEGRNHGVLKRRLQEDEIDCSHIAFGSAHRKGKKVPVSKAISKEECLLRVFIANSPKCRNVVKTYLKRYQLIPYLCECGNIGTWKNLPLSLQLDHINGISNDNRLENLRWICPNCHSQTANYAGRALKNPSSERARREKKRVFDTPENRSMRHRKYTRPSKEEMEKLVWEFPISKITKIVNVPNYQCISKWCKSYGIELPPRGYWKRKKSGHSHQTSLSLLPRREAKIDRLSLENESEIVNLYKEGYTLRAISKYMNYYRDGVLICLKKNNVEIRSTWKGAKSSKLISGTSYSGITFDSDSNDDSSILSVPALTREAHAVRSDE